MSVYRHLRALLIVKTRTKKCVFFLCPKIVQMNKNGFFRFHLNIYVFLCIIMVKEELEND